MRALTLLVLAICLAQQALAQVSPTPAVLSPSPSACPLSGLRLSEVTPGGDYKIKNLGTGLLTLSSFQVTTGNGGANVVSAAALSCGGTSTLAAGVEVACTLGTSLDATTGAIILTDASGTVDYMQYHTSAIGGVQQAAASPSDTVIIGGVTVTFWTPATDFVRGTGPYIFLGDNCSTGPKWWKATSYTLTTAVSSCAAGSSSTISQSVDSTATETVNCALSVPGTYLTVAAPLSLTGSGSISTVRFTTTGAGTLTLAVPTLSTTVISAVYATIAGNIALSGSAGGLYPRIVVSGPLVITGSPTVTVTFACGATFVPGSTIVFLTYTGAAQGSFAAQATLNPLCKRRDLARAVTAAAGQVACAGGTCTVTGLGVSVSPSVSPSISASSSATRSPSRSCNSRINYCSTEPRWFLPVVVAVPVVVGGTALVWVGVLIWWLARRCKKRPASARSRGKEWESGRTTESLSQRAPAQATAQRAKVVEQEGPSASGSGSGSGAVSGSSIQLSKTGTASGPMSGVSGASGSAQLSGTNALSEEV